MAKIQINTLKPQIYKFKVRHPVTKIEKIIPKGTFKKEDYPKYSFVLENEHNKEEEIVFIPSTDFDLPNGEKGPMEIHLVGLYSKEWKDFIKDFRDLGKTGEELFSRIAPDALKFAASLIVGWLDNGAIDEPYSADGALELISNPENMWLLEQIQQEVIDQSNFFLKN